MIGLAEKSIVMGVDDARDYVNARIEVLNQKREELLDELTSIENQIQIETDKLFMLNNPPTTCNCPNLEVPDLINIVGRLTK